MKLTDLFESPLRNQHDARKQGMMVIAQAKKAGCKTPEEVMSWMKNNYPKASYEIRSVVRQMLSSPS